MNKRLFLVAWVVLLGISEALAGEANYQPFLVGERALGMGGAVSVLIFLVTAALSVMVFVSMTKEMREANQDKKQLAGAKKGAK